MCGFSHWDVCELFLFYQCWKVKGLPELLLWIGREVEIESSPLDRCFASLGSCLDSPDQSCLFGSRGPPECKLKL